MKKKPVQVLKVYRGFASEKFVCVFGHVIRREVEEDRVSESPFRNALAMIRRYMVQPVRVQEVCLQSNGETHRQLTNKQGFFYFEVPISDPLTALELWVPGIPELHRTLRVSRASPLRVIVSDIDDTVLVSHSTNLLRKLYLLLTKNHQQRKVFEGIGAFYQELATTESDFFYVSSSEWNLYDFLVNFLAFNHLPKGPLLLKDLKTGWMDLFRSGRGSHIHKYKKIKKLMEIFPDATFVLIGDSGQQDPFIYERIAMDHSRRIQSIYIRDVRKSRRAEVLQMKRRLATKGVPVLWFSGITEKH